MIVKAYAKINLSLDIKGKREDGYHDLETIMLPLELHDSIEIKMLKNAVDDYVICDDFALSIGKYNLCHTMINAARKKRGFQDRFKIFIHKNIFIQAGLGGGSADAAATLLGILSMLNIKTTDKELIEISKDIGSDIPWSLFNKPCLVKRKGEVLEFIQPNKRNYVVIVKPEKGLSTQLVFNNADLGGYKTYNKIEEIKEYYENNDLEKLNLNVFNSLEETAIKMVPEIKEIKDKLKELGANVVLMSGAGSSVFGICESKRVANKIIEYYDKLNIPCEITKFH